MGARKIPQTIFPCLYLHLRANGLTLGHSSLRLLSKISPLICLSSVMSVEVRNITEEEARGIVAIAAPVPRDHAGSRRTADADPRRAERHCPHRKGELGVVVSSPLRTLAHLMGRSARSDLGAGEVRTTSENVQRRRVTVVRGLIGRVGKHGERSVCRRGSGS